MFDILNKDVNIHHHYILEASAGTGKTFSIENIVVRLLIEDSPLTQKPLEIQDILVVTFTRAAAHDLRLRIRDNILKILAMLTLSELPENAPDYLQQFADPQSAKKARKNLEKALFSYDQAQIYTIHSFCSRMLRTHFFEGDLALHALSEDEKFTQADLISVMRNFFRTELLPETYGQAHFKLLLKQYDDSLEKLEKELANLIFKGIDISPTPTFQELFLQFQREMSALKQLNFSSHAIIADFYALAPMYTGLANRQKSIKPEVLSKVECFAALFDQQEWSVQDFENLIDDQLYLLKIFDPSNRSKKALNPSLLLPDLLPLLKQRLEPLVNPLILFARLAYDCQNFLKHYQREEEKLRYDDLLHATLKALEEKQFAETIQQTYKAALIDEFQDTDPVQWKIFDTLFLKKEYQGYLYLVGDPKQSIYSFRQADIYTYLAASQAIGEENKASLMTNYRSHPSLVKALNFLFSSETSPNFVYLPKEKKTLPCLPVLPSEKSFEKNPSDSLGSVHFILSKEEKPSLETLEDHSYFPFIVKEIDRLHTIDNFAFRNFAILVADRYQGQRVAQYLKSHQIPSFTQRPASLADSPALPALQELLKGILNPRHTSSLKIALGGKILGWNLEKLTSLHELSLYEATLAQVNFLRKTLLEEGFAPFYQLLMHEPLFGSKHTISETFLQQTNGELFFEELEQIAEILIVHQYETNVHAEGLISFLDEFEHMQLSEDERLKKRLNTCQDAVQIVTQHSSKGLEYEIVFILGLIKRNSSLDQLLAEANPSRLSLILDKQDPRYQAYCEEIDAEKMRQLYVAFTRAKYRVYAAAISPQEKLNQGFATPMELFLARINQPASSYSEIYERIKTVDYYSTFCQFLDSLDPSFSITYTYEQGDANENRPSIYPKTLHLLTPPANIEIPDDKIGIYSFTLLSKQFEQSTPTLSPPHDFSAEIKNPHSLPAGNATGLLLHEILEHFPFETMRDINHPKELSLASYLEGTDFLPWESTIAEILFKTLKTPFKFDQETFCLQEIPAAQTFREIEFLYPCDQGMFHSNTPKGFLKGVIDLVFEHEGKYYIIDWKTNWLGPDQEAYAHPSLANAMIANNYHLQSAIYVESLKRYLRIFNHHDFLDVFGGIYYLFLRGVDPSDNCSGFYPAHSGVSLCKL